MWIFIFFVVLPIVLIIALTISLNKSYEETKRLFDEELYPMVDTAFTREELRHALDTLIVRCLHVDSVDKYTKSNSPFAFRIHSSYANEYRQLRERLLGRIEQLNRMKKVGEDYEN